MKRYFVLILLGVLVGVGWNMRSVLLVNQSQLQKNVKGASINPGLEKNLGSIQQQINNLPFSDIASSSPQIQKILKDMQGLAKYPLGEAKAICETMCKNL